MEFEKLVKLARHCSARDACIKCPVGGCSGPTGLMSRLADAIEELSKPRWIPVTERLPEEYTEVLCYYEYFRYGDYNCMFRTIDRGYFGDGRWGGEAGQGRKNKVLAWMPLPEPPKEE